MRIAGVIAEYNPFHLGHAHQLRQAREAAHADAVVAVMSGCFCSAATRRLFPLLSARRWRCKMARMP